MFIASEFKVAHFSKIERKKKFIDFGTGLKSINMLQKVSKLNMNRKEHSL